MIDLITLDTVKADGSTRTTTLHEDSPTSHIAVVQADGLYGWPAPRQVKSSRTDRHGGTNRNRWLDVKPITLRGEVWDVSIGAAFAHLDAVGMALAELLKAPGLLKWHQVGGRSMHAVVALADSFVVPIAEGAPAMAWTMKLEQPDPRAYSQTLRDVLTSDLSATGGGLMPPITLPITLDAPNTAAEVTNAGTIDVSPVIRIYGPITSPQVVLQSTGERVVLHGEIIASEFIELDHDRGTALLNGGGIKGMSMLDNDRSTFFAIPPGTHRIRFLPYAVGPGAYGEVLLRDGHAG